MRFCPLVPLGSHNHPWLGYIYGIKKKKKNKNQERKKKYEMVFWCSEYMLELG